MLNRLKPALALATLLLGLSAAFAADPIYGPNNQAFPAIVVVDPTTGKPASLGGGGATSGAVYGPDAAGASPTKPPILGGYTDANGKVQPVAPGTPLPIAGTVTPANGSTFPTSDANLANSLAVPGGTTPKAISTQRPDGKNMLSASELPTSYPDTAADTALGAPGDAAPLPGAAGSLIAQIKALIAQSASYTSAGTATASGTLPNPATMPSGGTPRGFAYSCDSTTPANSKTTLTLAGGGTTPLSVPTNYAANTGISATAATAVTGCTFQALY